MKLILFISLTFSFLMGKEICLGNFGSLYDVKEENIKIKLKREFFKKKDKIVELAKEALESGLIYKRDIRISSQNKTINRSNIIKAISNMRDKDGKILYHKGDNIKARPLPEGVSYSLCIVQFETFSILDEIIDRFGKNCRYVFLNVDIRDISSKKKYEELDKYIGNDSLFDMFEIDAVPVKITLYGNKQKFTYLSYPDIKKSVELKKIQKGE